MDTIDSWDDKVSTSSMLEYQISLTDKTKYDTLSYSPTVHERNSDEFTQLSDYSFDTQINDNISLDSARCSMISVGSVCTNSLNADKATKSFLQLKGVCIANYYMGCNFNIAATLQLMIQYELSVLAIQEHTPWNRELSLMEMAWIEKTCHKWGFSIKISKLQLIIFDQQLATCHQETKVYDNGRIINSRFEISGGKYVNFIAVYGIPHSPENHISIQNNIGDENTTLQKLRH